MRATILSIGAELLRGDIVDTNAAFLARELTGLGFSVDRQVTVGDELSALSREIEAVLTSPSVLVCTGGLGPTEDDLTRRAIASALHEDLHVDENLVSEIEARFTAMGRVMPLSNRQQAELIPSSRAIPNSNGTAPGWLIRKDGSVVVALPGPPGEMKPMWLASIRPELGSLIPDHIVTLSLMTYGLGESTVEERITDTIHWRSDVQVATYAKSTGVQVHVTARASSMKGAQRLVSEADDRLRERLGDAVFGTGDATLSSVIGGLLRRHGKSLSVMESATGGTLSGLITNVPGSSLYFMGGIVAYSRMAKGQHGVDRQIMDTHGLISGETASAMAEAVRKEFQTDIGLGVTGIAGDTQVEEQEPGTCFVAVSQSEGTEARRIRRPGQREVLKHAFALSALDLLRRQLVAKG